jgi:multisubunit Na+/H+ antiporter MnhG subunit
MKNKITTIKNCPKLSAMFSTVLATLIAFNLLFVVLLSGPLATNTIESLIIALVVTVIESVSIVALLRAIPHHEGEMSEEPLKA